MLDEPGQVTRDLLLTDVALEPSALKVFGLITRPGLSAGMIAAFNVNKSAQSVAGKISVADVEGFPRTGANGPTTVAVYRRSNGSASLLHTKQSSLPFSLDDFGYDLFTLAPVNQGVAVFGLLDKYLGPAAVVSQKREANRVTVLVREAGDFGAWLDQAPAKLEIDGRALPASSYSYSQGLLRVSRASFGDKTGEREIRITLASRTSSR